MDTNCRLKPEWIPEAYKTDNGEQIAAEPEVTNIDQPALPRYSIYGRDVKKYSAIGYPKTKLSIQH